MTFADFQRLGYALTEKEVRKYEREIIANYQAAYRDISAALQKQYLKVLSGIDPLNYYNEMMKYNRLNIMLDQIVVDYYKYANASGKATIKALQTAFEDNYYRQQFATSWGATSAKFTALPKSLIELATIGTDKTYQAVTKAVIDKFGQQPLYMPQVGSLSALLADNARKEAEAVRRSIISGLRNGNGYQTTARAVRDTIGFFYKEKGVDKVKGAMASAMRIVRTEGTRVLNAASFANSMQLESQGLEVYKQWMSTLDNRTRDRHQSLDGQKRAVDKPFEISGDSAMYPGEFSSIALNVNCRCTSNTIVPGLEPDIRIGRDPITGENSVFGYQNYDEWRAANE